MSLIQRKRKKYSFIIGASCILLSFLLLSGCNEQIISLKEATKYAEGAIAEQLMQPDTPWNDTTKINKVSEIKNKDGSLLLYFFYIETDGKLSGSISVDPSIKTPGVTRLSLEEDSKEVENMIREKHDLPLIP